MPEQQLDSMGLTAFDQIRKETPTLRDPATNDYVRCVADAIIRSMPGETTDRWEVVVFDSPQVNAFALPGGKIGVYAGLLKTAANQDQLATVIGHEIAHVQARHANERVSTSFATQSGLQVIEVLAGEPSAGKSQVLGLLGVGAQVGVLLPFSRIQESEADEIGLQLMAAAGFDPRQSIPLWENMQKAGGGKPPEFLSTHPSGETRIRQLGDAMPAALATAARANAAGRQPRCR